LASFSNLVNNSNSNPIGQQVSLKQKNIDCILLLLKIADLEGNYLKTSWLYILKAISQLELMNGGRTNGLSLANSFGAMENVTDNEKEPVNQQQVIIADLSYDKVFSSSVELNDDAIVDFVRCLCNVAHDELFHSTQQPQEVPRQFSLTKIIEVAYYNMRRIKIVWSRLWQQMSELFIAVGCHPNQTISVRGIDHLKIMAVKFLEQDELANYHFQRDFLKPFMEIIRKTDKLMNREMVIQCISYMIMKRARNIKSGWKIILQILALAAKLINEHPQQSLVLSNTNKVVLANEKQQLSHIMQLGFDSLSLIIEQHLQLIYSAEAFEDVVNCLNAYAKQQILTSIALKAIQYLKFCTDQIVDNQKEMLNNSNDNDTVEQVADEPKTILFTDAREHLRVWFPILTALSHLATDESCAEVQRNALDSLFDILNKYGGKYSSKLWEIIYSGVLLPIFDEIKYSVTQQDKSVSYEWCVHTMNLLVNLVVSYGLNCNGKKGSSTEFEFLINDVLSLIQSWFNERNELNNNSRLAIYSMGNTCLLQLITQAKNTSVTGQAGFSDKHWMVICDKLLLPMLEQRVSDYIRLYKANEQEQADLTRVIILGFKILTELPENKFIACVNKDNSVYEWACDLVLYVQDIELRKILRHFLLIYKRVVNAY
jgi:brefeldin A-inhibited guanine nucleotide-exchange protein